MARSEIRERLENAVLIIIGAVIVCWIIVLYRGGVDWFSATHWGKITILEWAGIGLISFITLLVQYYLLMVLRHSLVRHLFWLLPALWIVNNALLVVDRFIQGQYGRALTGWLPLTDLVGWLLSVVYFPLLAGGGAVVAIADSHSYLLTPACHYANAALETTGVSGGLFNLLVHHLGVFWDMVSNSFLKEVVTKGVRPFVDFSTGGMLRLPHWFFNFGYSFVCVFV